MKRLSPIFILLLLPAARSLACLNDTQTLTLEQEFRSRYESASAPGTATVQNTVAATGIQASQYQWSPGGIGLTLLGAVIVATSIHLTRSKSRALLAASGNPLKTGAPCPEQS